MESIGGTTVAVILIILAAILIVACIIVFIVSRRKQKRLCSVCNAELLDSWQECPYCKQRELENGQVQQGSQKNIRNDNTILSGMTVDDDLPMEDNKGKTVIIRQSKEKPILAYLIVKQGQYQGNSFQLAGSVTAIGRSADNDIVISDESASRNHAKVLMEEGKFYIHDLASGNGTFVNGNKILRQEIFDGDEIQIGETKLVFKVV